MQLNYEGPSTPGPFHRSLGEMLPSSVQYNLNLNDNSAEVFTELERVYRELKDRSLRWMLRVPEPEADQTTCTASGTQEANKAERVQALTNDRDKCPEEPEELEELEELEKPESDSEIMKKNLIEEDLQVSGLKMGVSNMDSNSKEEKEPKEDQAVMKGEVLL